MFRDLGFLAPGGELRTFVEFAPAWFERQPPREVRVRIHYHNGAGRRYITRLRHQLDAFADTVTVLSPTNEETRR